MMTPTGWCPSCTCGWHKALDAFDVTPPEATCRNVSCGCHDSYWQSVDMDTAKAFLMPAPNAAPENKHWNAMGDIDELEKRRLYGDR